MFSTLFAQSVVFCLLLAIFKLGSPADGKVIVTLSQYDDFETVVSDASSSDAYLVDLRLMNCSPPSKPIFIPGKLVSRTKVQNNASIVSLLNSVPDVGLLFPEHHLKNEYIQLTFELAVDGLANFKEARKRGLRFFVTYPAQ